MLKCISLRKQYIENDYHINIKQQGWEDNTNNESYLSPWLDRL